LPPSPISKSRFSRTSGRLLRPSFVLRRRFQHRLQRFQERLRRSHRGLRRLGYLRFAKAVWYTPRAERFELRSFGSEASRSGSAASAISHLQKRFRRKLGPIAPTFAGCAPCFDEELRSAWQAARTPSKPRTLPLVWEVRGRIAVAIAGANCGCDCGSELRKRI